MSGTLAGAMVTAGVLGVTHAVEPDHVAGISSLTAANGDARISALVGAWFSLGHVALVAAWLLVASLVFGRTDFPPVYDRIGTLGAGVVLVFFGAAMAVAGVARAVRTVNHAHGVVLHNHTHTHTHVGRSYLKTSLVGAVFTLSPPVSMLVFATVLFSRTGAGVVSLAVLTYGVAITATMSLLGAGVGVVFERLDERGPTYHATAQAVAGVAVTALGAFLFVDAIGTLL